MKCTRCGATLTKPKLQLEPITAADAAHVVGGKIIEIRNVTLKEALQLVRALADRQESRA
jgi:hypothetical protein